MKWIPSSSGGDSRWCFLMTWQDGIGLIIWRANNNAWADKWVDNDAWVDKYGDNDRGDIYNDGGGTSGDCKR